MIFNYSDFYSFLISETDKYSKIQRGGKKEIAEYLNIPSSLLSQTFDGSRKLTFDQVYLFCEFMSYTELESEFVYNLFHISNTFNKKLILQLKKKLEKIKRSSLKISERVKKDRVLTEYEKSILYSSWYYIAIWAFLSIDNGKTIEEVSVYFKLPINKVKDILSFLVETRISKCIEGRYHHDLNSIHIEKSSPFYKQHHNNWRLQSISKLDLISESDLNFTAPLSLSKQDFDKVREEIMKLIQGLYLTVKETNPERIYCLNIDFFSI